MQLSSQQTCPGEGWAALISSRPALRCVRVPTALASLASAQSVEAWPFSLWGHPHSGSLSSRGLGDSGGICHNVATWAPWTLAAGRILTTPGLGCPGGFQACFVCPLSHGHFQSRWYPPTKAQRVEVTCPGPHTRQRLEPNRRGPPAAPPLENAQLILLTYGLQLSGQPPSIFVPLHFPETVFR